MDPVIEQTAKDYDLEEEIVEAIYKRFYPDNFYAELEIYVNTRKVTNNNQFNRGMNSAKNDV